MIIEKTPNNIILQKSQLLDEIIKLGNFSFHYDRTYIGNMNAISNPIPKLEINLLRCPEHIINKLYELYSTCINSNT